MKIYLSVWSGGAKRSQRYRHLHTGCSSGFTNGPEPAQKNHQLHFSWVLTVAVCCSVLRCIAVCCSVLQCVAVCMYIYMCVCDKILSCIYHELSNYVANTHIYTYTLHRTATHCNTLQHTATHCNTLQHTATHCNTLKHKKIHACEHAQTLHKFVLRVPANSNISATTHIYDILADAHFKKKNQIYDVLATINIYEVPTKTHKWHPCKHKYTQAYAARAKKVNVICIEFWTSNPIYISFLQLHIKNSHVYNILTTSHTYDIFANTHTWQPRNHKHLWNPRKHTFFEKIADILETIHFYVIPTNTHKWQPRKHTYVYI